MNKLNIPVFENISYNDNNCIILEIFTYSKFAERWVNKNRFGFYFKKRKKNIYFYEK